MSVQPEARERFRPMVDFPVPINPMRMMFRCMLFRKKTTFLDSIREAVSAKDLPWTQN